MGCRKRDLLLWAANSAIYENYKVDGIINSDKNGQAALEMPIASSTSFTPPGWAKTFFVENNQAITENLAAMSMNYFAFFPALVNEASNPNAKVTGFFANPAGPDGDQFAALGGQGISVISYSENQEEAMTSSWSGSSRTKPRSAGPNSVATPATSAKVLESEEFQNATPYNKAFYETMFKVKDFWATPEYAELLHPDEPAHLSLLSPPAKPARRRTALDALAARLERRRSRNTDATSSKRVTLEGALPPPFSFCISCRQARFERARRSGIFFAHRDDRSGIRRRTLGGGRDLATAVMTIAGYPKSRAASRGHERHHGSAISSSFRRSCS